MLSTREKLSFFSKLKTFFKIKSKRLRNGVKSLRRRAKIADSRSRKHEWTDENYVLHLELKNTSAIMHLTLPPPYFSMV